MEHSFADVLLILLPVAFVIAVDPYPHCSRGDCGQGEKRDTDGRCVPCGNGSFMIFTNHSCKSCYKCDEAELEGEIIRDNCTDSSNAIVVCEPGYFNTGGNIPASRLCHKCQECTNNEFIWRNCTETQNTLCKSKPTTSTVVPDNESTSFRNDLSTTETANTESETTVSPTSNFNTTVPQNTTVIPGAEGDSVIKVIAIVVSLVILVTLFAAIGIYKPLCRFCRKENGAYEMTQPGDRTDAIELVHIKRRE